MHTCPLNKYYQVVVGLFLILCTISVNWTLSFESGHLKKCHHLFKVDPGIVRYETHLAIPISLDTAHIQQFRGCKISIITGYYLAIAHQLQCCSVQFYSVIPCFTINLLHMSV